MSDDIRANIIRSGITTPIARNVMIQLDKISPSETTSYQGSDPHFSYRAFTVSLPLYDPQLILFRDYLVDIDVIDAITLKNRQYLIINDPERHIMDGHWQFICTRMRGT